MPRTLREVVESLQSPSIGVVGDVMIDEWFYGSHARKTKEYGTEMDIVDIHEEEMSLGGAANVARNINFLGGLALLYGVIGEDHYQPKFLSLMRQEGLDYGTSDYRILFDRHRRTTIKTRVLDGEKFIRFDREDRHPLSEGLKRTLFQRIRRSSVDLWVVSDYQKGMVDRQLIQWLLGTHKPVIVDPKGDGFKIYKGAALIKPNLVEYDSLVLNSIDAPLVVTKGCGGIEYWDHHTETRVQFRAWPVECKDAIGAGDAVIAAIAVALASGSTQIEATAFGNLAGAVSVTKEGTHKGITKEEMEELLDAYPDHWC